MASIIKEYEQQEKLNYLKAQAEQVQKECDYLRRQVEHLDKFVDLDARVTMPLCGALETNRALTEVMSMKPTRNSLTEAQELRFLLEAQVITLRHNVEDVLAQGIDFLRLPEDEDSSDDEEEKER